MILAEKKALVTGGSRGIGRAIALALAREGADVAFTYFRNRKAAEDTAELIRSTGRTAKVTQVDLARLGDIEKLFRELSEEWGRLDIFVSNAVSATLGPIIDLPLRHWERMLCANLTAFFVCSRRAVPLMEGRPGKIIAISSLGSQECAPGYAALGVAKAGIETLSRYLAVELAQKNVNVNVVCPGYVKTRAINGFRKAVADLVRYEEQLVQHTPAGRAGLPEDVAQVVVFLCSPASEWIRGQTIIADGGFSLVQV